MCRNHSTVRGILQELPSDEGMIVIDLEASPEHMTRATTEFVDHMLLVAEPYFKSLETARRYHALAVDLGIPHVSVVANKIRPEDHDIVEEYCRSHGFDLVGTVPFEPAFGEAERDGSAPYDVATGTEGVKAISRIADQLREGTSP